MHIPRWWRKPRFVVWLLVMVSQVRGLHITFLSYRRKALYGLQITGQVIYLEKALNGRWDPDNLGIWIESAQDVMRFFVYNKMELQPSLYLYNRWSPNVQYALGEFAEDSESVWVATQATPPLAPDNPGWDEHAPRPYFLNQGENSPSSSFIIHVPSGVVFDEAEMRALVDTYKLAGKNYTIETY